MSESEAPKRIIKSEAELMAADISTLTEQELGRRSLMLNIRKAERESEMIENQNEEYQTKKEEKLRMKRIAVENAEAERQKTRQEQEGCAHKTGGEGLGGFFQGDGAIYGTSTAGLILPTGEVYYMCFRCQKEWHRPSKRKVLNGEMSLAEYREQEKAYNEAARWPRKSFAPWNGELCSASTFTIPKLQMQQQKDNIEFNAMLEKLAGRERTA